MVEPLLPNMVDRADALIPVCSSLPALVFGSLRMLVVDAMGCSDSWFWIGGLVVDASVAQWRDCGPYMAAGRVVAAPVSVSVMWAAAIWTPLYSHLGNESVRKNIFYGLTIALTKT